MANFTDETKVTRVRNAFGEVASQYVKEGSNKKALAMINALETLSAESMITLFDIIRKDS